MASRTNATILLAAAAAALVSALVWKSRKQKQLGKTTTRLVIIFSGKRKSGKDFVTDRLKEAIVEQSRGNPNVCAIGRLSGPLKKSYAEENGLDFAQLLSDGPYKEKFREDMIRWGEEKRAQDHGFFARIVMSEITAPVVIISDARRETDLEFFVPQKAKGGTPPWKTMTVRVEASVEERSKRGFVHAPAIDEAESECGLDNFSGGWDVVVRNDGAAALPCTNVEASSDYRETTPTKGGVQMQILALAKEAIRAID